MLPCMQWCMRQHVLLNATTISDACIDVNRVVVKHSWQDNCIEPHVDIICHACKDVHCHTRVHCNDQITMCGTWQARWSMHNVMNADMKSLCVKQTCTYASTVQTFDLSPLTAESNMTCSLLQTKRIFVRTAACAEHSFATWLTTATSWRLE